MRYEDAFIDTKALVMNFKVLNDGTVHEICKLIVESGRHYATKTKATVPLMYAYYDTEYLGAAHGLCSILQVR